MCERERGREGGRGKEEGKGRGRKGGTEGKEGREGRREEREVEGRRPLCPLSPSIGADQSRRMAEMQMNPMMMGQKQNTNQLFKVCWEVCTCVCMVMK